MIVISDTSPLNYLILINQIEILPQLFQRVIAPNAVVSELRHSKAPESVRKWANRPPAWLEILDPCLLDPSITLDSGEIAAICLAREIHADKILIDERAASEVASKFGLYVMGTLAVLDLAAEKKLLNLSIAFEALQQSNFRCSKNLFEELLKNDRQRENKP